MRDYYSRPTQVIFVEEQDLMDAGPEQCVKCDGIAYTDFVICNCCGGVIPLDEIAYIYEQKYWYDYGSGVPSVEVVNQICKELKETYDWMMEDTF